MKVLKARGTEFVFDGEPIRLKGFGLGSWLNIEHFMIGLPSSEKTFRYTVRELFGEAVTKEFFGNFYNSFIGEDDFRFLKECGVNCVRVPINYRLFIDDQDNKAYKEEGFTYLDRLLKLCEKYEIFALIDLHTTPGGQNPDWHSDNDMGVPLFWQYQVFRKQTEGLWREIAKRLSSYTYLMGYDLLNEPAMADWSALNEFYEDVIGLIREVDQDHMIILEGDQFSMDFSGLKRFEDDNLALGFHYYPTVWHPDLLSKDISRDERKARIEEGLLKLVGLRDEFDMPAFCGEFGYGRDCGKKSFTRELLEDTLEIYEKYQLDWFLWSYKDADFMSIVYPEHDTKWMKLTKVIESKWSQDIEKEQATELLEYLKAHHFKKLTEEDSYMLQFRIRAMLYYLQQKYILAPLLSCNDGAELVKMPSDFEFDKCVIYDEMKLLVEKYIGKKY